MAKRTVNARGVILKKTTLVDARQRAGFTQESLARFIKKKHMTAWRAENGKPVDVKTASLIAKAVNIALPDLIQPARRTA